MLNTFIILIEHFIISLTFTVLYTLTNLIIIKTQASKELNFVILKRNRNLLSRILIYIQKYKNKKNTFHNLHIYKMLFFIKRAPSVQKCPSLHISIYTHIWTYTQKIMLMWYYWCSDCVLFISHHFLFKNPEHHFLFTLSIQRIPIKHIKLNTDNKTK